MAILVQVLNYLILISISKICGQETLKSELEFAKVQLDVLTIEVILMVL